MTQSRHVKAIRPGSTNTPGQVEHEHPPDESEHKNRSRVALIIVFMISIHLDRGFSLTFLANVPGGSGIAFRETPQHAALLAISLLGLYFRPHCIVLYPIRCAVSRHRASNLLL